MLELEIGITIIGITSKKSHKINTRNSRLGDWMSIVGLK